MSIHNLCAEWCSAAEASGKIQINNESFYITGGMPVNRQGTTHKNSDCLWLILNILSTMLKQGG